MKTICFLIFITLSFQSLACRPTAPSEMNFHVDLEKEGRKFYSSKRILDDRPSISMDGCTSTAAANNYVMLGLGIENIVLTNDTIGYSFTPQEETLNCKLENNPFDFEETKEDRFSKNKRKREFFDRCVVVQVTELNENIDLRYPEDQAGCQIEKKSKWSVDFSGSYCFFQPYPESRYSVHLDVKESCLSKEVLKKNKTILSDYNAILNTYVAGDATGFSSDLTALSTTQVRFSVGPLAEILPISPDYGRYRPRWPTTWEAADIYFGQLNVHSADNNYDEIQLPLVVNTYCDRKCSGKLCTSPCDYSQPVVGEFSLYEMVDGKKEFIKLWYDGSVASANYQGLLHGMGVTIPKGVLKEGKDYQVEAIFREPDLDFSYYSGQIDRLLRLRRNYIGPLSRTGQINLVPQINTIDDPGSVPNVPLIRNLSFDNTHLDGLSRVLATWRSKLNNQFWPPYYEKMCGLGNCENSGSGVVKLKQNFSLSKNENDKYKVILKDGERKSNIVSDSQWNKDEIPEVDCGLDINDDDDDFDWGDIL